MVPLCPKPAGAGTVNLFRMAAKAPNGHAGSFDERLLFGEERTKGVLWRAALRRRGGQ
jgi:hypothetical protein